MAKNSVQSIRESTDSRTPNLCSWLREDDRGVVLSVHARPGAKKDAVAGVFDGKLKVALAAPPVDGKANAKLCAFLAKKIDTSKSGVTLISGETSREKRVRITDIAPEAVLEALSPKEN